MLKLTKLNQILIMLIAVSFRYVALFHSSTFLNYFLLLILCLLTFYNLLTIKFSSHKFRTITILLLLSIIVFFLNNEDNLFIYLITALAFLEVEDKQLIKLFLTLSIFCFITIIVAGQVGIIDIVTSGRYINEETIYRNSLGFGNVNTPFIYFLGIVFAFITYLKALN